MKMHNVASAILNENPLHIYSVKTTYWIMCAGGYCSNFGLNYLNSKHRDKKEYK